MSDAGPPQPEAARAAQRFAEILAIVALFFVAAGDPTPGVNEQHYLTRLKHYWDPDWCRGDLFLESPDAHLTIVLVAGWATKLLPLSAVAWLGRLLAWSLLAWAWQRLSWAVVPRNWCAVLSAGLWLVGMREGHFAGEWVVGGVEAKCFAYIFVLLALQARLEDRWRMVWVHLGLATALHALVGGWSVLIMLGQWLVAGRGRPSFGSMLPAMALGGVIGLAGVAPPIVMNSAAPSEVVAEANQIYVYQRLPHHLAPLSKPADWLLERGGRHAAMLTALAVATWYALSYRRRVDQTGAVVAKRMLRLCDYAWGAVVLLGVGLVIESSLSDSPEAAAKLLRYYWYRLSDIAAPLAVAVVATHAIVVGLYARRAAGIAGLVVAMAAIVAHLGPVVSQRMSNPRAPADVKIADNADWQDVCQWARENTPDDALFLTPRASNSFKWRAHRAEVATWKDIPQDAASMVAWWQRLYNIYTLPDPVGERTRARSLGELGAERLRQLGEEYAADFVLTDHRHPPALPVAYQNATYVVYDLRE